MTKVLTIASGKGGAGKTSISLNLSLALAGVGYRVCLFDADLGLANVNILTGLYPEIGLAEVLEGSQTLSDIMIRNFNGIDIIPGSSGVEKLADLTSLEAGRLIQAFLDLPDYDYFIMDTSAGISAQVLSFCRASQEMVLVVTPEPTSLTDAYSLLKVLSKKGSMPRIRVVVNQVRTADEARKSYAKLKKTAARFLSVPLAPLGIVARDPNVSNAVISQVPFLIQYPDTQASRCMRSLVLKLIKNPGEDMPVEAFWDHCLELLGGKRPEIQAEEPTAAVSMPEEMKEAEQPDSSDTQPETAATVTGTMDEAVTLRLDNLEEKLDRLLQEMADLKKLVSEPARPPKLESGLKPELEPGLKHESDPLPPQPGLAPSQPVPSSLDPLAPVSGFQPPETRTLEIQMPETSSREALSPFLDSQEYDQEYDQEYNQEHGPQDGQEYNQNEPEPVALDFEAWLAAR